MIQQQEKVPVTILLAEDDPADRLLTIKAFKHASLINQVRTVADGQELLEYLRGEGDYADPEKAPYPDLILLDLNMPRKDGRLALSEIRADPELRGIPVVVLTTSREEEDVLRSYDLGANSFITKPVTFEGLVDVVRELESYWFELVRIPGH